MIPLLVPDIIIMLATLLSKNSTNYQSIIPTVLLHGRHVILDLSHTSKDFKQVNLADWQTLAQYTQTLIQQQHAVLGIGRYAEDRQLYLQHELYHDSHSIASEPRTIHLGIDLTCAITPPVFAPLEAHVHSYKDNQTRGDYGPTIILQHEIEGITFYTLYGHLSRQSLSQLSPGQYLQAGEQFATVGSGFENGGWPPHLHFQIIADLQGNSGDYPGVCRPSERASFLKNCPDPNLILQI